MAIIGWLILGLAVGFIASRIVRNSSDALVLDLVLGIVGGAVGGFLFSSFGAISAVGFDIYSMIEAIMGAVVVVCLYHAIADGTLPVDRGSTEAQKAPPSKDAPRQKHSLARRTAD